MHLTRRKIDHSRLDPIEKMVRGVVSVILVFAGLIFWRIYPMVTFLVSGLGTGLLGTILLGHRPMALLSRIPLMRFARRTSAQK